MIKKIIVKGVRGINDSFELGKVNYFTGENGAGKSTMISIIKQHFKGRTTIKEGEVTIIDQDDMVIQSIKGTLTQPVGLGNDMELMTPGFFLNKKVKGVNSTTQEQRSLISKLLDIDRDAFFQDKGIDYEIKGLYSEKKEKEIQIDTLTKQIIVKENELSELKKVIKPRKVELQQGNDNELERLKSNLETYKSKLVDISTIQEVVKPNEVKLVATSITEGNRDQYDRLIKEQNELLVSGKELAARVKSAENDVTYIECEKCNHKNPVKSTELITLEVKLEDVRNKYRELSKTIQEFKLIERQEIKGNEVAYTKYMNDLNAYNAYSNELERVTKSNTDLEEKIKETQDQISSFKLVKSNKDKYDEYQNRLLEYQNYINKKDFLDKEVDSLSNEIQELNLKDVTSKIESYQNTEKDFVKFVEERLQLNDDVRFVFYRELSSPNSKGESYEATFDVEYKGKLYSQCSGGEKGVVDVVIAKMFIDYLNNNMDFILIDNAEISDANIQSMIDSGLLSGLQLIVTRIGQGPLSLVSN